MKETSRKLCWAALRWLTILVVLLALIWTFRQGWIELQRQEVQWSRIKWVWLLPALLLTWLGTTPGWLFWHSMLRQFGLPISLAQSFRAFYLSQLGKYVPGKVMVVAIRTALATGLSPPSSTNRDVPDTGSDSSVPPWLIVSAAAVAETLMFVAVGSGWGVICGAYFISGSLGVLLTAVLIAATILVMMLPPVLRFWFVRLPLLKSPAARKWLANHWDWRLFVAGGISFSLGWIFLALGLLSLTNLIPDQGGDWSDLPRALSGVTLSTVLGFFSFIPGGLGVRELVLFPILRDRFAAVLVIIVLHRLVTLASESLAALATTLIANTRG